jgi:hypothetical protein
MQVRNGTSDILPCSLFVRHDQNANWLVALSQTPWNPQAVAGRIGSRCGYALAKGAAVAVILLSATTATHPPVFPAGLAFALLT